MFFLSSEEERQVWDPFWTPPHKEAHNSFLFEVINYFAQSQGLSLDWTNDINSETFEFLQNFMKYYNYLFDSGQINAWEDYYNNTNSHFPSCQQLNDWLQKITPKKHPKPVHKVKHSSKSHRKINQFQENC